jgi:endoglucanase
MQHGDGSVAHKVSTLKFGGFILPERELEQRYFTSPSTAAAADFVAMLSQASRCFEPYDHGYARTCLEAARKTYGWLLSHTQNERANLTGFSTGAYQTGDADDRLWAAAELWQTTGDPDVLQDLETRLKTTGAAVRVDFDWGEVGNLGVITYVASLRQGRNEELLGLARTNMIATAERILKTGDAHGYARPLGTIYYWGCNGSVARQSLVLETAYRLTRDKSFRDAQLDALNHLFGRNVHGRSYVTGLGARPPMRPHDRRSGGDTVDEPWPGYLVGGPHPKPANWNDVQEDYRTNEIAINWNGALIYALAAVLEPL